MNPGESLQRWPEAQVGEVVVDQAQRDAVDAAQGPEMNDVVAFINAKGFGDVAAGRAQYRQQLFAGRVAALIEQILAEARLGIERIVDWAHQHQHANP